MLLASIAVLLLALAGYVVAMNWMCLYFSYRNVRHGIAKQHSMVPLVSLVLVALAWMLHDPHAMPWLPESSFWAIALADISLWSTLWLPVFLLLRKFRDDDAAKG